MHRCGSPTRWPWSSRSNPDCWTHFLCRLWPNSGSGLRDALDRGAPDAVRLIQESGTLDDARKQALRETLRQYVQSVTPTTPPKAAGQP